MSFTRANPSGWAFGSKLTSAQQNQLDTDHALALDKSVAGDAIAGTVTFMGSGKIRTSSSDQIEIASGNGLIVSAGSGIVTTGSGSITAASTSGINTAVANGIVPLVAGGISDGGITHGIQATVIGGIESTVGSGIRPTVPAGISDGGISGGIAITASHGLVTSGSGSIQLNAGVNDWLRYGSTRTLVTSVPLGVMSSSAGFALGTGWSMSFTGWPGLVGGATTNQIVIPLNDLFTGGVNGSTLTGATLAFFVPNAHGGGIGSMIMPYVDLRVQSTVAGAVYAPVSLFAGGFQQIPNPGSGAAWSSSGNVQNFAMAPNQNNLIRLDNSTYYAVIQDENGTGSAAGNVYLSLILTFTAIANSAPG